MGTVSGPDSPDLTLMLIGDRVLLSSPPMLDAAHRIMRVPFAAKGWFGPRSRAVVLACTSGACVDEVPAGVEALLASTEASGEPREHAGAMVAGIGGQ